ncbi:tripartite tricarboxylate transporter TctB family protein [Chloroflexota bacterium]
MGAWLVGFALFIYLLGFLIAVPLYTLFYMKQRGSRWLGAFVTAVLFTAIIYIVFEVALGVILYKGVLFA